MRGNAVRRRRSAAKLCFLLGGICVSLALLPTRPTVMFWISALAHECGHAVVMHWLGMPVRRFSAYAGGGVLAWDAPSVPYFHELLEAAAGPLVNAVLAACFHGVDAAGFFVNALLLCYNLLPLRGNDGAVILQAASEMLGHGEGMRRILRTVGEILWAVLLMLGAWIFWFGALHDSGGTSAAYGALFFCVLVRGICGVR